MTSWYCSTGRYWSTYNVQISFREVYTHFKFRFRWKSIIIPVIKLGFKCNLRHERAFAFVHLIILLFKQLLKSISHCCIFMLWEWQFEINRNQNGDNNTLIWSSKGSMSIAIDAFAVVSSVTWITFIYDFINTKFLSLILINLALLAWSNSRCHVP